MRKRALTPTPVTADIAAAAAGEAQFSTLTVSERAAAHALIDARIAERADTQRFGPAARAAGRSTVSLDSAGHIIEIAPNGRRAPL